MLHALLLPFLAGLLVGVNPFIAPALRARLDESDDARRRFHLETSAAILLVTALIIVVSWRFSAFISGRLTNSLLFLGLFALAGAFYSLRPIRRRRDPEPHPTGWRWPLRYAGDAFYYGGPAWILALAAAMQQITLTRYILPFLATAAGVILATYLWTTRYQAMLPRAAPSPDEPRTRASRLLSLAYGVSAVLMLAANLKLI